MMRTWPCSIAIIFFVSVLGPLPVWADTVVLPLPGTMVRLSQAFNPAILKGIKVHPDNPFRFDFVLSLGDKTSAEAKGTNALAKEDYLKQQSIKLIKYFLASLTIPEKDLWVNLSPYEKDRIVPEAFGQTEMGRDLLAQDYILKQITASLIYPEDAIGKQFWKRIYEESAKKFGNTNIPVNTFNKVWIVPDKAVVYENTQAGTAYVVESKLKVMLEEDYLAMDKNQHQPGDMFRSEQQRTCSQAGCQTNKALNTKAPTLTNARSGSRLSETNVGTLQVNHQTPNGIGSLGSQIVREVVLPQLTKEINQGQNFAQLRQVYNSLILATWYKKKVKDSILSQVYADKNKVAGVTYASSIIASSASSSVIARSPQGDEAISKRTTNDTGNDAELIYQQYLQAFKKGAYNFIKEEQDPLTQQPIPRKYFSGGLMMNAQALDVAMLSTTDNALAPANDEPGLVFVESGLNRANAAMAGSITYIPPAEKLRMHTKLSALIETSVFKALVRLPKIDEFNVFKFQGRMIINSQLLYAAPDGDEVANFSFELEEGKAIRDFFVDLPRYGVFFKTYGHQLTALFLLWLTDINQMNNGGLLTGNFHTLKRTATGASFFEGLGALWATGQAPKVTVGQTIKDGKTVDEIQMPLLVLDRSKIEQTLFGKTIADSQAMISKLTPGGIDFNSDKMNLETRNEGEGIKFKVDPAMLKQFQDAPGFEPVILNVRPMTNIRLFLGITDTPVIHPKLVLDTT